MMLLLRALFGLAMFDVLLMVGNFSAVHGIVRRWNVARKNAPLNAVEKVSNAVNLACMCYPKQALCLQRAVVTVCLLRSCGVPAQLVLGAQKTPFLAHAWAEVRGRAINERSNVRAKYGVWERC